MGQEGGRKKLEERIFETQSIDGASFCRQIHTFKRAVNILGKDFMVATQIISKVVYA